MPVNRCSFFSHRFSVSHGKHCYKPRLESKFSSRSSLRAREYQRPQARDGLSPEKVHWAWWKLPQRAGRFSTWVLPMGKQKKMGHDCRALQKKPGSTCKCTDSDIPVWSRGAFKGANRDGGVNVGKDGHVKVQLLGALSGQPDMKRIILTTLPRNRSTEQHRTCCSVITHLGTWVLTYTISGLLRISVIYFLQFVSGKQKLFQLRLYTQRSDAKAKLVLRVIIYLFATEASPSDCQTKGWAANCWLPSLNNIQRLRLLNHLKSVWKKKSINLSHLLICLCLNVVDVIRRKSLSNSHHVRFNWRVWR